MAYFRSKLLPWRSALQRGFAGQPQINSGDMFSKILVANRGEIAMRIMKTAKRMGIRCVAVYSEADANAMHTLYADEAVCIGPPPSALSYLNMDAILDAAQKTGAQAVHPGYGFLSENAGFAQRLEAEGIAFVGPPAAAIAAMGDKLESKAIAKKARVNTIPGFVGVIRDADHAVQVATEIGFPVMIKASAGGGGKGMRIAWNKDDVVTGFRLSAQEAKASFGDDRMLIEKFIEQPRHIEMQVLGDKHGHTVFLPERECSVQRRNQKVVEEAPSVVLNQETRAAMGAQALALCRAVGYHSAGTLEFMLDRHRQFFFLEFNTRLQVEHPITELITRQDLVEHMLRIAAGQRLQLTQEEAIDIRGWAVECRVYAEDPARNFLPSIGRLTKHVEPLGPGVRVDAGVREGSEISMHYDPLISKLVTHAPSRPAAIDAMCSALDRYVISGVQHNVPLLRAVVGHPAFRAGDITTAFLPDHFPGPGATAPARLPLAPREQRELLALAAWLHLRGEAALAGRHLAGAGAGAERWERELVLTLDEEHFPCTVRPASEEMAGAQARQDGAVEVELSNEIIQVCAAPQPQEPYVAQLQRALLDGQLKHCQVLQHLPRGMRLQYCGAQREVLVQTPLAAALSRHLPKVVPPDTSKIIASPMPGSLISLAVKQGDEVEAGDEVAVVEAMKMRNVVRAERAGRVSAVEAQPGAVLAADQVIVRLE